MVGGPSDIFVGRRDDLAQLISALEDSDAGGGSLVMLVGEPGIGKTRVVVELCREARDGAIARSVLSLPTLSLHTAVCALAAAGLAPTSRGGFARGALCCALCNPLTGATTRGWSDPRVTHPADDLVGIDLALKKQGAGLVVQVRKGKLGCPVAC